jgi:hypothetical protein
VEQIKWFIGDFRSFGLFDKKIALEVGGYDTKTVGRHGDYSSNEKIWRKKVKYRVASLILYVGQRLR